jgi:hypothetical protein
MSTSGVFALEVTTSLVIIVALLVKGRAGGASER